MNSCKEIKSILEKYISGEITDNEMTILDSHTKMCASCKEMVALHDYFITDSLPIVTPEHSNFEQVHRNVFNEIKDKDGGIINEVILFIKNLFPKPAIAISFAIIMLLIGVFIPRLMQDNEQVILGQIKHVAYMNKSFSDVENSPYIFENVKFKSVDENRIALSFDLVTHLEIVRSKNDPIVKEALAQSLLTSKGIGGRLKAISFTKEVISPKIKETLIYTMLNDPNFTIRLKTMESLKPYKDEKNVQQAFLNVLEKDESVQMRMRAIEYLTGEKNSTDAVMKELGGTNKIINLNL